jgi:putative hydrolase of HD superfamily
LTEGRAWREHGITLSQALTRNRHMAEGAPALWEYVEGLLRDAAERGYLKKDE